MYTRRATRKNVVSVFATGVFIFNLCHVVDRPTESPSSPFLFLQHNIHTYKNGRVIKVGILTIPEKKIVFRFRGVRSTSVCRAVKFNPVKSRRGNITVEKKIN